METNSFFGLGWLKDMPDIRDFTLLTDIHSNNHKEDNQETVKDLVAKLGIKQNIPLLIPATTDLTEWCTPIEHQLALGSCTAQAGVGMMEYYEKRSFGKYMDASSMFLYKVTRNMLGWVGDTGAYLRTTIGAITIFGLPPESYCPYIPSKFDEEPSAFLYAYAQNFQGINYFRLDPAGTETSAILINLKNQLAVGLPAMFGSACYTSLTLSTTSYDGAIPFPQNGEKLIGGHAVMAVGYDDYKKILNPLSGTYTLGAVKIRNSWGTEWGEAGYGWLPYEYILTGIASDFWCLLKAEYLETGHFGL